MTRHRAGYKHFLNSGKKFISSFDLFNDDDVLLIVVGEVFCCILYRLDEVNNKLLYYYNYSLEIFIFLLYWSTFFYVIL